MDILKLTKSKTRQRILQLFFSDDGKEYYLRELERILNISVANIRRELLSLEKSGIFKKKILGNLVYYSVNKQSPIFNEIKQIVSKTIGLEFLLKNLLKKVPKIKIAFIFGSFAQKKEDSFSDVDLMIIGNPDEDLLVSRITKTESRINREINYHIFSPADWNRKLKENNSFLENILSRAKVFLIGNKNDLSGLN